jgi:hypothetical protein
MAGKQHEPVVLCSCIFYGVRSMIYSLTSVPPRINHPIAWRPAECLRTSPVTYCQGSNPFKMFQSLRWKNVWFDGLLRKLLELLEPLKRLEQVDQLVGVISKTTRSMSGGESRRVRICRRNLSSATCPAMHASFFPLTVISTAGFLIMF